MTRRGAPLPAGLWLPRVALVRGLSRAARVRASRPHGPRRVVGVGRVGLVHVDRVALGRVALGRVALRRVGLGGVPWGWGARDRVRRRLLKVHLKT